MRGTLARGRWLLAGVLLLAPVPPLAAQEPQGAREDCAVTIPEWAPRGSAETVRPRIVATITSTCETAIDVASVRMTVDEEPVAPAIDGNGEKVTVVYVPESALLEEADHTVTVDAMDVNGIAGQRTWTFYLPDTYLR